MLMLRILLFLAVCWAPQVQTQAYAQANPDRLDEIRREEITAKAREAKLAQERESIQREIAKLKSELIEAAKESEKYERETRETADRLDALRLEEKRLKAAQSSDRETVTKLLGALQRLENNPPPALIVAPEDAANAARAARLMANISENLKSRAQTVTERLTELAEIRGDISAQGVKLAENERDVARRREAVKKLVDEKSKLEKSISADLDAEKKRMAALAAEADTLEELLASVESASLGIQPRLKPGSDAAIAEPSLKPRGTRPPATLNLPSGTVQFAKARGHLKLPINGRVERQFGGDHKGITLSARSQAQVVSPYTGRIEFTGPFKNYDNVIILNVGDGYYIVMTGMGDIYAKLGDTVKVGEPLGIMPVSRTQQASFYMELWKDSAPIDPMPWIGTSLAQAG